MVWPRIHKSIWCLRVWILRLCITNFTLLFFLKNQGENFIWEKLDPSIRFDLGFGQKNHSSSSKKHKTYIQYKENLKMVLIHQKNIELKGKNSLVIPKLILVLTSIEWARENLEKSLLNPSWIETPEDCCIVHSNFL